MGLQDVVWSKTGLLLPVVVVVCGYDDDLVVSGGGSLCVVLRVGPGVVRVTLGEVVCQGDGLPIWSLCDDLGALVAVDGGQPWLVSDGDGGAAVVACGPQDCLCLLEFVADRFCLGVHWLFAACRRQYHFMLKNFQVTESHAPLAIFAEVHAARGLVARFIREDLPVSMDGIFHLGSQRRTLGNLDEATASRAAPIAHNKSWLANHCHSFDVRVCFWSVHFFIRLILAARNAPRD